MEIKAFHESWWILPQDPFIYKDRTYYEIHNEEKKRDFTCIVTQNSEKTLFFVQALCFLTVQGCVWLLKAGYFFSLPLLMLTDFS